MDAQLLVCLRLQRDAFQIEDYTPQDHVLALVASGSFTLQTGTAAPLLVEAGQAAWFHAGVRYHRVIRTPAELYLFRFRAESTRYPEHRILFQDRDRIFSTLRLLRQLDEKTFPEDFSFRQSIFQDLLTQLAIESGQPLFDSAAADPIISDAVARMKRMLHRKLVLEQFSARYGISYVHFCRRFKEAMGMTPTAFLLDLRLRKAKTMLADTDLAVYRIAAECGFENEYYFSNFFKKHAGCAPTAYRRESQRQKE